MVTSTAKRLKSLLELMEIQNQLSATALEDQIWLNQWRWTFSLKTNSGTFGSIGQTIKLKLDVVLIMDLVLSCNWQFPPASSLTSIVWRFPLGHHPGDNGSLQNFWVTCIFVFKKQLSIIIKHTWLLLIFSRRWKGLRKRGKEKKDQTLFAMDCKETENVAMSRGCIP